MVALEAHSLLCQNCNGPMLVQIMNEGKNEGDCHAACIEEVCVYFDEIYVSCRDSVVAE